jgi:hypothetical protein
MKPTTMMLACGLLLSGWSKAATGREGVLGVGRAQLGAPLEWLELPDRPGVFHLLQRTRDGLLVLTPNEGFFPKLGLLAGGQGVVPDVGQLNGGQSFGHVEGWDTGDSIEWGLWLPKGGELSLRVRMSSPDGRFGIRLDGRAEGLAGGAPVIPVEAGRHILRVECLETPAKDTRLLWVEASGSAIKDAAVLRKRWRPAAAHTQFSSSLAGEGVRMWIMEMDAVPGELDFYAPLTTPFGYYGPTWLADGRVNTGMNFSLWSYGRNEKEPPVNELSHLLAIGNRTAEFSGFGHEGTGVKIRGWEPLTGRQGQRQAFALRVEPGPEFNTYHSYFYATDERRWRLFGVGRQKPKRRPLTHLTLGSFVEVPGPPPRQRTGSTPRRMRYRGWVSRDGAEWLAIDTMKSGDIDKETGLTYTDRGLDGDGWFFMETGGWFFRKASAKDIARIGSAGEAPDYLRPEAVKTLLELPAGIDVIAVKRGGKSMVIDYRVRGAGRASEAFAYFGENEGLTLAERWTGKMALPAPKEGVNRATIRLDSDRPQRLRLFLRNDEGQFWSFETAVAK